MAKVYDPIMCMLVDEPTKAQDELKIKKEDGLWCVYKDGKVVGQSNSEAGAIRIYNRLESTTKAHDANTLYETFAHGNSKHAGVLEMNGKVKVVVWNEGDNPRTGKVTVIGEDTPANRSKAKSMLDSASTLDKAIKTCDGMFQQIFGKYSSAAKQHYDRAVKELDSFKGEIKDYLTLAGKWEMQIRNDLTRIDEAYNTAGNDYYAARREIQETMDSLTQVMLRKAREKRK